MARRYHVYKIVKVDNETLYSQFANSYSNFGVEYEKGLYVKPKIGKLFAYAERYIVEGIILRSEKHFSDVGEYQAWECLTTTEPVSFFSSIPSLSAVSLWSSFWDKYPDRYFSSSFPIKQVTEISIPIPHGTVLCDDLKLWKQIS